ncbi:MAG: hypothetical protein ACOYJB_04270 [Christensenellaceae bacterium]|jgi:hypothetical protein
MENTFWKLLVSAGKTIKNNFFLLFWPRLILSGILYGFSLVIQLFFLFPAAQMNDSGMISVWSALLLAVNTAVWLFISPVFTGFTAAALNRFRITGKKETAGVFWAHMRRNYKKYLLTMLASLPFSVALGVFFRWINTSIGMNTALKSSLFPSIFEGEFFAAPVRSYNTAAGVVVLAAGLLYTLGVMGTAFIPECEGKSGFGAFFASFRYAFRGNFFRNLWQFLIIAASAGGVLWLFGKGIATTVLAGLTLSGADFSEQSWLIVQIADLVVGFIVSAVISVFYQSYIYELYQNAKLSAGESRTDVRRSLAKLWKRVRS